MFNKLFVYLLYTQRITPTERNVLPYHSDSEFYVSFFFCFRNMKENVKNSIKVDNGGGWVDSLTTYSCALISVERKEVVFDKLPSREWKGEDGEDTYFPSFNAIKAYDVDIKMAYKGSVGNESVKMKAFIDWMRGSAASAKQSCKLNIKYGRDFSELLEDCYLTKVDNIKRYNYTNALMNEREDEVILFTLKVRVTS